MTSVTDVCNRMLQVLGTRTSVTDSQIANNSSNEAIQFNIMYAELRDRLLRMAPWDCAMKTANLTYITSSPGTPENTSAATNLWAPGQPPPPWAYEYQYPVDCLSARWIIPSTQTGFASGIPITTAVTGGASSYWWGSPIRFKVQIDQFYPVTAAAVVAGGSGYVINEIITLASTPQGNAPIGAPAQLKVLTVDGSGAVLTASVVNVLAGAANPLGGSYFLPLANPVAQGSSSASGTGATFNLTFAITPTDQRVILTNQEYATLAYTKSTTDPNTWDPSFRDALYEAGAAKLVMALTGSRDRANDLIKKVNDTIRIARADDANEGLTINDVTPDWIRVRGVAFTDGMYSGPYQGYDWGPYLSQF